MTQQKLTKQQEEKLEEISKLSQQADQKMRSASDVLNQLEKKIYLRLDKQCS